MQSPQTQRAIVISFAVLVVLVAAIAASCSRGSGPVIPTEPQTLSGTLVPVSLSRVRRGTHVLQIRGKDIYFVESSTVSLRPFERQQVTVHGMVEPNINSEYLPVLVVDRIDSADAKWKSFTVSSLKLALELPASWQQHDATNGVQFQSSLSALPVLILSETPLPDLPLGVPMTVDGAKAVRTEDTENQEETVFVARGNTVLTLRFVFDPDQSLTAQSTTWMRLLRSVKLEGSTSSSAASTSVTPSTGTGAGAFCGGTAGILCPSGFFCEITDQENGIGKCRQR